MARYDFREVLAGEVNRLEALRRSRIVESVMGEVEREGYYTTRYQERRSLSPTEYGSCGGWVVFLRYDDASNPRPYENEKILRIMARINARIVYGAPWWEAWRGEGVPGSTCGHRHRTRNGAKRCAPFGWYVIAGNRTAEIYDAQ